MSKRPKLWHLMAVCIALAGSNSTAEQGPQSGKDRSAVRVDAVNLTEVQEWILNGLNVGTVLADQRVADGVQKAADVWGLQLDLFVNADVAVRSELLAELATGEVAALITDAATLAAAETRLTKVLGETTRRRGGGPGTFPLVVIGATRSELETTMVDVEDPFQAGFDALRTTRAMLLPWIPKYDELFNLAFPITPMPDSFFQPTKFPYPEPAIRSVRTVSSTSASGHAHTSCHAVALLGNMIHRTSKFDEDIFLLGFEGGNLSIKARPGAVTRDKLSAVMTSYVIGIRGNAGERRDLLSENDGLPTSAFRPAAHAPEELEQALKGWVSNGTIKSFEPQGEDEVVLSGFKGADRRFRAGFFMVSSDQPLKEPLLQVGVDGYGRWTFEFLSTQGFVQLFGEVPMKVPEKPVESPDALLRELRLAEPNDMGHVPSAKTEMLGDRALPTPRRAQGGMLTEAGAMVGSTVGFPLGGLLTEVKDKNPRFKPYVLTIEGGFLAVTPELPLTPQQLRAIVQRVDIDERGPLGSDQTITVSLFGGERVVFRRTVVNFSYLDKALADLQRQALVSGWEYVGARGQGLASNAVLHNLFGKHRKFMSSLNVWPSHDRSEQPYVRWYVDGMQRLNFSMVTPEGWRQEFVEVPLRVTPIPRDVQLFSGVSTLD